LVYTVGTMAMLIVFRARHLSVGRLALIVATSLVAAVAYTRWHAITIGHIQEYLAPFRERLLQGARAMSVRELAATPLGASYFVTFDSMFYGWNGIVLLGGPLVIAAYRRRALMLLLGVSVLLYLLIIRVSALSIPYIYFTYSEILFTPVRNVVFFIYLLTGPLLYLIAGRVARI